MTKFNNIVLKNHMTSIFFKWELIVKFNQIAEEIWNYGRHVCKIYKLSNILMVSTVDLGETFWCTRNTNILLVLCFTNLFFDNKSVKLNTKKETHWFQTWFAAWSSVSSGKIIIFPYKFYVFQFRWNHLDS